MMEHSAAYIFNQSEVSDELAIGYLQVEKGKSPLFAQTWDAAVMYRRNTTRLRNIQVPDGLREEHVLAVIAYTVHSGLFSKFNEALRQYGTCDSLYAKMFPFKSFHYLLSIALERLGKTSTAEPATTYRGMQRQVEAQPGDYMKFGYFASSSLKSNIARMFGNKTLLIIRSRMGVNIAKYSAFEGEEEVLIPPYEVFNITENRPRTDGVNVSLDAMVKSNGIHVRVERGPGCEMRVTRSAATAISALGLCWALALLAPTFMCGH